MTRLNWRNCPHVIPKRWAQSKSRCVCNVNSEERVFENVVAYPDFGFSDRWCRSGRVRGLALSAAAPGRFLTPCPRRRTRNSDRPRASDRTLFAAELHRLPSFKNRRTL
jgi:hypothetical protein